MVAWVLTYPIFIIGSFGWTTLPLCVFIVFILMKLEQMAGEMQEPFGYDTYDLALEELCTRVERNVYEVLMRAEGPQGSAARDVRRASLVVVRPRRTGNLPPALPRNFTIPKPDVPRDKLSAAKIY